MLEGGNWVAGADMRVGVQGGFTEEGTLGRDWRWPGPPGSPPTPQTRPGCGLYPGSGSPLKALSRGVTR